jgi:hypothetical protein
MVDRGLHGTKTLVVVRLADLSAQHESAAPMAARHDYERRKVAKERNRCSKHDALV